MEYLIPILIMILVAIVLILIFRRKHNAIISDLDKQKLQIQHKPILEEMTKVKQLNMNGQTEEMFERWRTIWNEVMDHDIPEVDSLLFDAEDFVDKMRFGKASQTEQQIKERLHIAEEKMNSILEELHNLIGSEEKNRIEMEQIQEQFRSARKNVLAHQYSFGEALPALEKELESFQPEMAEYNELTSKGNYMSAREVVMRLKEKGDQLFPKLHDIPTLFSEVSTKIPATLHELRSGKNEMESQGYFLDHLEITQKLDSIDSELVNLKQEIAQLSVGPVKRRVDEMKDELDSLYDLLEKEVRARGYVDQQHLAIAQRLDDTKHQTIAAQEEANYIKQNYHLSDEQLAVPGKCLDKLAVAESKMALVQTRLSEEKSAYSSLEEELRALDQVVGEQDEVQSEFHNRLKNLRIDENSSRAKIVELKRELHMTERSLQKANLPGVPEEIDARFEEADENIFVVEQNLQEVPLNMSTVDANMKKAEGAVQEAIAKAKEMLENAMLVERIIQYGNRYRATNTAVNVKLLEAEHAFRQKRYTKALEEAGIAVEQAEPGALKKIQKMVKEQQWNQ
ncbi:septation ring formation regulator EzrA [Chryseomicrobium sp. FSL W7-1435]|uniref:septation ring formation regulator EzrA n=1 Tax=Chryseomicrobium sp. FSL W7-1435 TaxID=2921704 RepID=UPI00315ADEE4